VFRTLSRAAGRGRGLAAGIGAIVAVGASLALALTFAPSAAASGPHASRPFASLPHLGPAPQRCELGTDPTCPEFTQGTNFTVESSCGAINISPHVVNVGQDVTATMVETARQCRIQWGSPPGKLVAGCKDGVYKVINPQDVQTIVPPSSTCEWKATEASSYPPDAKAPGGGWDQFEVGFCAFVGCAALASDYYYVLPHKKAISGTVYSGTSDAVGNRVGLADAVVKLSGASSGSAVTNRDGFYDALVDPGQYTVHVESVAGQSVDASPIACSPGAASGSDCKLDVGGADGVADFNSCGGSGAAGHVARAAASSAPSCPTLKVTITMFGSGKAGLGFFEGQQDGFATPLPEFLAASTIFGEGKCVSGCTNVQVTVTDKRTGAVVPDAQVTASVTPFQADGIAPYPKGFGSGDGHLCRADNPSGCGSGRLLTGLPPTDPQGQVRFLYWAPGVISQHDVKITAKAEKSTCDPKVCRVGLQTGEDTRPLTISPHLLYSSQPGRLAPDDVNVLTEWAHDDADPGAFGEQVKHAITEHALSMAISHLVEFYAEHASPALVALELAHKVLTTPGEFAELHTALGEQEALTALFVTPLKLATLGLGAVNAGELDPGFLDAIAGKNGLLRQYGTVLEDLMKRKPITDQEISVRVEEVSYCSLGMNCGPGDQTPGINPFVYLYFQGDTPASSINDAATVFRRGIVLPYNAQAYTDLQCNSKLPPC
jgi:hypothetical protein